MIQVRNAPDKTGADGQWLRSYREEGVRYHTRGGCLWNNIQTRCKIKGSAQQQNQSYIGTINGFKDFQSFMAWCSTQYGYNEADEDGTLWQLDKDILVFGSKVYSPETCVFVPQRLNKFILENPSIRGSYAIGVRLQPKTGKYTARCKDGEKCTHLGTFSTETAALHAWLAEKTRVAATIIRSPEIAKSPKLVSAIEGYITKLKERHIV